MGFYAQKILPLVFDKGGNTPEFNGYRQRLLATARGRVLEIGFGTGLSAPYYPQTVEQVVAIDPNDGHRPRALKRISEAAVPIELRTAVGEHLPLEDRSFDCVVTSMTLCSVTDLPRTLAEIGRVLKPGGRYLLWEHGLSDDPAVQRWQHRLNGFQMRMFGGCHLDRPIRSVVEEAGFRFDTVESFYFKHVPRPLSFSTLGSAVKR
jgi:ubiquinone/menaquinone biosynthesis C-methylase UbiE